MTALLTGHLHIAALRRALERVDEHVDTIEQWGRHLAGILAQGGRLLAVGNGGSARKSVTVRRTAGGSA